ncbi:hypothetical protein KEM52_001337 [Ascosphaera acerosa]|nr:hypothetical protein KEM52_001337 [Ascosphaera acerosa]
MGKRKKSSRKPIGPRKREPLPSTFACLFCNHENCVVVKLDKKLGVGNLTCKICGQRFQSGINYLSAAVDVYADWVDACDAVAKETAAAQAEQRQSYGSPGRRPSAGGPAPGGEDAYGYDGLGGAGEEDELSDY